MKRKLSYRYSFAFLPPVTSMHLCSKMPSAQLSQVCSLEPFQEIMQAARSHRQSLVIHAVIHAIASRPAVTHANRVNRAANHASRVRRHVTATLANRREDRSQDINNDLKYKTHAVFKAACVFAIMFYTLFRKCSSYFNLNFIWNYCSN